jgi:hypothetical protein
MGARRLPRGFTPCHRTENNRLPLTANRPEVKRGALVGLARARVAGARIARFRRLSQAGTRLGRGAWARPPGSLTEDAPTLSAGR